VRHGRRTPTLRAQVLAVALVPSLLLLAAGLTISAVLVSGAKTAQARAAAVADAVSGASALLPAISEEGRLSLLAVSGDRSGSLEAARKAVDDAYAVLLPRLDALDGAGGSEELTKDGAAIRAAVDGLAGLRRSVDAGRPDRLTVAGPYDAVQDAALKLVAAAGPRSAGEEVIQSRSDAEVLLRAADQLVGTISEIAPLRTEEELSALSGDVDDLSGVEGKRTTTVALDFGRITVNADTVLYLFGTPGQNRFWFLWDELATGSLGAVVLADTRRLADCFPAVDFFERRNIPFVLAVNHFDGAPCYTVDEVRVAADLPDHVPLIACDARRRSSTKDVLLCLLDHLLQLAPAEPVRA
jgi:uncharacterized protein